MHDSVTYEAKPLIYKKEECCMGIDYEMRLLYRVSNVQGLYYYNVICCVVYIIVQSARI